MAFIAAAENRLRKTLQRAAGAVCSKGFMVRLWLVALLAMAMLILFKSIFPLLAFIRQEMLPHLRDSSTVLNTQPFLFLLLNSMIFAVLAPSGLFNDRYQSSSASEFSSPASSSEVPAPESSFSEDSPVEDQCQKQTPSEADLEQAPEEEPQVIIPTLQQSVPDLQEQIEQQQQYLPQEETAAPAGGSVQQRSLSSSSRSRSETVSPPKTRRRVKKIQKSASVSSLKTLRPQITMGIVEHDEPVARNPMDSARNQPDSLKDEDFKQFIDSFIARAHQQMIRQEREFAAATRSTARSRS